MRKVWATTYTALTVLYFAYGSNMDLVQMGSRCERAATVSTAELPLHRFIINSRGSPLSCRIRHRRSRGSSGE